ncbi:MAG: response regulator transcription factor [Blautia sp.]|nr:response regulator transcription factor [Blautia sp.]
MIRLLLAEDEQRMADALKELLGQEGYEVTVFGNGIEAMAAIVEKDMDMAILDVMLPGCSGFEIAAAARAAGKGLPILMLTARSTVEDKVTGLDSGADDYLTKPFDVRELLARVRAMTRRVASMEEGKRYGDLLLTMETLTLLHLPTGQSVQLTPKEAKLMEALLDTKGRIISREQLALRSFGYQEEAEYNQVEVYLTFLRRKLKFLGSAVEIKAKRGLGYELKGGKDV